VYIIIQKLLPAFFFLYSIMQITFLLYYFYPFKIGTRITQLKSIDCYASHHQPPSQGSAEVVEVLNIAVLINLYKSVDALYEHRRSNKPN